MEDQSRGGSLQDSDTIEVAGDAPNVASAPEAAAEIPQPQPSTWRTYPDDGRKIFIKNVRLMAPADGGWLQTTDDDTAIYLQFDVPTKADPERGVVLTLYGVPEELERIYNSEDPQLIEGRATAFTRRATEDRFVYVDIVLGPCNPLVNIDWHDEWPSEKPAGCKRVYLTPGNGLIVLTEIDARVEPTPPA